MNTAAVKNAALNTVAQACAKVIASALVTWHASKGSAENAATTPNVAIPILSATSVQTSTHADPFAVPQLNAMVLAMQKEMSAVAEGANPSPALCRKTACSTRKSATPIQGSANPWFVNAFRLTDLKHILRQLT